MSAATKTLAALAIGMGVNACIAEQSYDEQFFSLFETNHLSVAATSAGAMHTLKVGMSMSEVVSCMGKPFSMCPGTPASTGFMYFTNAQLVFKQGSLEKIWPRT